MDGVMPLNIASFAGSSTYVVISNANRASESSAGSKSAECVHKNRGTSLLAFPFCNQFGVFRTLSSVLFIYYWSGQNAGACAR